MGSATSRLPPPGWKIASHTNRAVPTGEAAASRRTTMAFAYINEFDVGADRTTSNYDQIQQRLGLNETPADGLILHVAGFAGDKFRMIDIWETAEQEERYRTQRLYPALREVVGSHKAPPRTQRYELHNVVASR
jgi:hypothetical protein